MTKYKTACLQIQGQNKENYSKSYFLGFPDLISKNVFFLGTGVVRKNTSTKKPSDPAKSAK